MKKRLCILLVTFIVFNASVANATATEVKEHGVGKGEWCEEDYEKINCALNCIGYNDEDTVYFTELQQTYSEENKKKYVSFIYDDEKAIGQYIKEEVDSEINSCFIINKDSKLLNELVKNQEGSEFAIRNEVADLEAATDGAKNREM